MKSRNERGSERWKKALLDCEERVAVQLFFTFFNSSISGPLDVTICVLESRTEGKVHIWFSGLTETTYPNCAFILWLGHLGNCQSCQLSGSVNSWLTTVTSLCYKFKRFACSLIWQLCEVQNPLWPAVIHHFYFAFKGQRPDFISGLSLLALEWYETEYVPVCRCWLLVLEQHAVFFSCFCSLNKVFICWENILNLDVVSMSCITILPAQWLMNNTIYKFTVVH